LTGGGDCPGLNAVIRAIVRKGETVYGDELVGFLDAWDGVMERRTMQLDVSSCVACCPGRHPARHAPWQPVRPCRRAAARVVDTFREMGLDALVVIGGNGSLSVACQMHADFGLPIVGVPKTIDNDVVGTELTFGFNTAVQIATDAIDRLHTTAESHDRVMVVEVMGRHAAGSPPTPASPVVPPPSSSRRAVRHRRGLRILRQRHERGRYASIVVVAEGAEPVPGTLPIAEKVYDQYGHVRLGGIAETIAHSIEERTGFESRVVLLGHIQRGGTPTAFDRVLATRYGVAAIDAVHRHAWGAHDGAAGQRDRDGAARRDRRPHPAGRPAPVPRRRERLLRLRPPDRLDCLDCPAASTASTASTGSAARHRREGRLGGPQQPRIVEHRQLAGLQLPVHVRPGGRAPLGGDAHPVDPGQAVEGVHELGQVTMPLRTVASRSSSAAGSNDDVPSSCSAGVAPTISSSKTDVGSPWRSRETGTSRDGSPEAFGCTRKI
jgi:6-phosphofructokinase